MRFWTLSGRGCLARARAAASRRLVGADAITLACLLLLALAFELIVGRAVAPDLAIAMAAANPTPAITVDYPQDGSIFPPEITPPTFLWRDAAPGVASWRIDVTFADGTRPLRVASTGPGMQMGEIDPRCVSDTNKPPFLTPEQAAAHTWKPEAQEWDSIKRHSVTHPATVEFTGLDASGNAISHGSVRFTTSKDPVGALIFYRDVPLMPSEGAQHVVQPLAPNAVPLVAWRIRDIARPESRVVMHDLHTCANCHSFSTDGKTMGLDMDGPGNDKGLYAVVPVRKQMSIGDQDMVRWNMDGTVGKSRVGFMSQVSPDGRYVLTTFAGPQRDISDSYFVTNFKDYRFLQVFYPTRGILAWYDRTTGRRQPLPGADDPRYVQTDGVWSPDGKYVVFARAEAKEAHPAGVPLPRAANDPEEVQIQYSLYRVPFNQGRGGVAEPIRGASNNGMSNNFPKVSPDGRWIVFVQCRNGQLMRPDSQLYIVPAAGGTARRMRANTALMNSWHSFSPNGRWLVFSSKSRSPYTQMYLTHIDPDGNDSPPIYVDNATAANRAVNLPEFVNATAEGIERIDAPAAEFYRLMDEADALQQKRDYAGAVAGWRKALAMYPDDAKANNDLGSALTMAGRPAEAIPYLQRAIAANPNFSDAYYNLGTAYVGVHRLDEAIDAWSNAVRLRPDYYPAHEALGFAFYMRGDYTSALHHSLLALDGEPNRVSVLLLASTLMATAADAPILRNGKKAIELAERANELAGGQDAAVLDTLSAAYAESGNMEKAIETEEKALALARNAADAQHLNRLTAHLSRYKSGAPLRCPPDDGTL
ncbi:MAG: tetratricopeptide repeat protein [Acidobacteriota bacterium]